MVSVRWSVTLKYLFLSFAVHRCWASVYWRVPHPRSPGWEWRPSWQICFCCRVSKNEYFTCCCLCLPLWLHWFWILFAKIAKCRVIARGLKYPSDSRLDACVLRDTQCVHLSVNSWQLYCICPYLECLCVIKYFLLTYLSLHFSFFYL